MHPSIASYPNEAFYQGQLVNASLSRPLRGYPFPTSDPVAFVNILGHEELHESSLRNLSEALAIIDVVVLLLGNCGIDSDAIGIVTPYAAQVALIGNELRSRSLRVGSLASVDKSQGSERDVILVSTVRSNNHGAIGHVKDARRLNVALTRARRAVILFGNEWTLVQRDECNVWNPFFKFFAAKQWIVGRDMYAHNDSRAETQVAEKVRKNFLVVGARRLVSLPLADCSRVKEKLAFVVYISIMGVS
jgi:regulator of nonsense transcripts 1